MTETVNYPLPTVHLNGTSKNMLLEGNLNILDKLAELREAISSCEFHSRDYYVHDIDTQFIGGAYGLATEERVKHIKSLALFGEYIEQHIEHISDQ